MTEDDGGLQPTASPLTFHPKDLSPLGHRFGPRPSPFSHEVTVSCHGTLTTTPALTRSVYPSQGTTVRLLRRRRTSGTLGTPRPFPSYRSLPKTPLVKPLPSPLPSLAPVSASRSSDTPPKYVPHDSGRDVLHGVPVDPVGRVVSVLPRRRLKSPFVMQLSQDRGYNILTK